MKKYTYILDWDSPCCDDNGVIYYKRKRAEIGNEREARRLVRRLCGCMEKFDSNGELLERRWVSASGYLEKEVFK